MRHLRVRRHRVRPAGLAALGVDCVVGAVSKMIKPSADRKRKNDRNDAEFLARMLSVGNVVEVWVPDDECEAARDLVRALDDAREDLKRRKQRLSKFLMRHGYAFSETTPTGRRKGNWTAAHWAWIRSISFPEKADGDGNSRTASTRRSGDGGQGPRLEGWSRPRRQAQVEAQDRLHQVPEGHRRDERRGPGLRGRRVLQVQERQVVRGVSGSTPLRALQRRACGRAASPRPATAHLRRVLVESAWHYLGCSPHSKDLARGSRTPRRERGQGREKARREAARDARARRPQNKANVATARRARVLVLGGGPA